MSKGYDPNVHHRRSVRVAGYDYSQPGSYFVTMCTEHKECSLGKIADGQMVLNEAGHAVKAAWQDLPGRFPGIELDQFVIMPNHVHGIVVTTERQPRPRDASAAEAEADQSAGTPNYEQVAAAGKQPCAPPDTAAATPSARSPRSDAPVHPQSATQSVGAQFYCARQSLTLSPTARHDPAAVQGSDTAADQSHATGEPLTLGWIVRTFKAVATRGVRKTGLYGFAWQRNYYERIVRDKKELGAIREYTSYNPLRWGDDRENPESR